MKTNSKDNRADDGQEVDGTINELSMENDGEAATNNPNNSTLSQDSEAQSSSKSDIADEEFEKIFKGNLCLIKYCNCIYILQYIYLSEKQQC